MHLRCARYLTPGPPGAATLWGWLRVECA
jgi:hypothetical protein